MPKLLRIECTDAARAMELSRRLTCGKCVLEREITPGRTGGWTLSIAHETWCSIPVSR